MNREEAACILGVDDDTIDDLEDILEIDGSWTQSDLKSAAEILDGGELDDDDDDLEEDE